jgi:hypothetical protein
VRIIIKPFEVEFTSPGNMRVGVRLKDYHRDLMRATALALWLATLWLSRRIEIGMLENHC